MGLEDVVPRESVVVTPNEDDVGAEGTDVGPEETAVLGAGSGDEEGGAACRGCERPQPPATSAVASVKIDSARDIVIRRSSPEIRQWK